MLKICKEAQEFFNTLKQRLKDAEVVLPLDDTALEMIAYTYHNYISATKYLLENGITFEVTDRNGDRVVRPMPQIKIALDAQIQLTKLLSEFGMTPKSRKGFKDMFSPRELDDEWTTLLKANNHPLEKR
jgi:P27 family predicted phage terminase small subunit